MPLKTYDHTVTLHVYPGILDDDYQLVDTSQSLAALRGEYCEEVTPLARLGLRKLILELGGTIPQDFCQ